MKTKLKSLAVALRKQGYSLREIAEKLSLAQGTASVWLRNIKLSDKAQKRLDQHSRRGVLKGAAIRHAQSMATIKEIAQITKNDFKGIFLSKQQKKLACALLYWCEGSKNRSCVSFMNSDPLMMSVFINLFRSAFNLNESKFRLLIHVHEYHNDEKQKQFWSKITGIHLKQFSKSYIKPHTGKNKRDGYPGCAALKYYDHKIALELKDICELFGKKFGRVA